MICGDLTRFLSLSRYLCVHSMCVREMRKEVYETDLPVDLSFERRKNNNASNALIEAQTKHMYARTCTHTEA